MRYVGALFQILLFLALGARQGDGKSCHRSLSGCRRCTTPRLQPELDCPLYGYDCTSNRTSLQEFVQTKSPETSCLRLECADPEARIFIDRVSYFTLRCRDYRWRYGPRDCDYASHALCAKRCSCTAMLPKYIDDAKFSLPSVYPACVSRPCPVAYCAGDNWLYGLTANGQNEERILAGELTCTGDGQWRDASDGVVYKYALCAPANGPPGPGTGVCAEDCIVPKTPAQPPRGYAVDPLSIIELSKVNGTCKKLSCSETDAALAVNQGKLEFSNVYCYREGESFKFRTAGGDVVSQASCVVSCTQCVDDGFADLGDPQYHATGTKINSQTGCTKTLQCSELYYLDDGSDTTPEAADVSTVECSARGKWSWTGGPAGGVERVACKGQAPATCTNTCKTDGIKPVTNPSPPGVVLQNTPQIGGTEGCSQLICHEGVLGTGPSGAGRGAVFCKAGKWEDENGPVTIASCIGDCSECENGFTYEGELYTAATTSVAGNQCAKATSASACAESGGQLFYQEKFGDAPLLVIAAELTCNGVEWTGANPTTVATRIGCKLPDCTADCAVSGSITDIAMPPKYYGILSDKLTEDDQGGCMKLKCTEGVLSAAGVAALDPEIKCIGGAWKAADAATVTQASCVKECTTCDATFEYDDYQGAPIELDQTSGCLKADQCPNGNGFSYVDGEGVVHDDFGNVAATCGVDGKWHGSAGGTAAVKVGCKIGCAHCAALISYSQVVIDGVKYDQPPVLSEHGDCMSYKCPTGGQLAIFDVDADEQKLASSICCGEDSNWKVDGETDESDFKIACVKSCVACSTASNDIPNGEQPVWYTTEDGCLAARPCGNGKLLTVSGEPVELVDGQEITCKTNGKWSVGSVDYDKIACEKDLCTKCDILYNDVGVIPGYLTTNLPVEGSETCSSLICRDGEELGVLAGSPATSAIINDATLRCNQNSKWVVDGVESSDITKVACYKSCTGCSKTVFGAHVEPPADDTNNCLAVKSCSADNIYYFDTASTSYKAIPTTSGAVCGVDGMWDVNGAKYELIACEAPSNCAVGCSLQALTPITAPSGYALVDSLTDITNGACQQLKCEQGTLAISQTITPNVEVFCMGPMPTWKSSGSAVTSASCFGECTKCTTDSRPAGFVAPTYKLDPSTGCNTATCTTGKIWYVVISGDAPLESTANTAKCNGISKWVLDTENKENVDNVFCEDSCTQCTTPGNVAQSDFILAGYLYKKNIATGTDGTCSTLSCLADQKIVTDPPLEAQSTNTATCQASGQWNIIPAAATKATCAISCAECSTPSADGNYIAPVKTTTYGVCDALQPCIDGDFYYKHNGDNSYKPTSDNPTCVNGEWIISGGAAKKLGCKNNVCNKPLDVITACPSGHACAQLIKRMSPQNNNGKYICQMNGQLIFGHNGDARDEIDWMQCKWNQNGWHPEGNGFRPGPKATCEYECGTSCDMTAKPGRTQAQTVTNNGCKMASCSGGQLVGYIAGEPATAIGSARCLKNTYGNKWLSNINKFFDSVDCVSTGGGNA